MHPRAHAVSLERWHPRWRRHRSVAGAGALHQPRDGRVGTDGCGGTFLSPAASGISFRTGLSGEALLDINRGQTHREPAA